MEPEVAEAVKMLRRGATSGMVVGHLERDGVPSHLCPDIVSTAQKVIRRREWLAACLLAATGTLVIAVGVFAFLLLPVNRRARVQLSSIVTMTGLIVTMYGLLGAMGKRK